VRSSPRSTEFQPRVSIGSSDTVIRAICHKGVIGGLFYRSDAAEMGNRGYLKWVISAMIYCPGDDGPGNNCLDKVDLIPKDRYPAWYLV
jgi:hypothetical protein